MQVVQVVLPLALAQTFSYFVPAEMSPNVKLGCRCLVNFGKKKIYTGIIVSIQEQDKDTANSFVLKPLYSLLDDEPFISEQQLKLWNWLSDYYCCSIGEVLTAALPSNLLPSSETQFILNQAPTPDCQLQKNDLLVYNYLYMCKQANLSEIISNTGVRNPLVVLQRLIEQGLVSDEQIIDKQYKPVERNYVYFSLSALEANSSEVEKMLAKGKKQALVIKHLSQMCEDISSDSIEVEEKVLLNATESSKSTLTSLQKQGILQLYRKERKEEEMADFTFNEIELSLAQEKAFCEIQKAFTDNKPALLFGVTSSGKTEIYIKLIETALLSGRKVLYLLPEIALTFQIISRLENYFGGKIKVYHSKHTVSQRAGVYKAVLDGKYEILLGVRSSVLLPFSNLGLIIVDEEHEISYKQFDPDPRYNARDLALVLAKIHGANVLLGSATPSVESYNNAIKGRYRLVELSERYGNVRLPEIIISDMKDAYRRKINKGHFHPDLLKMMQAAVSAGEQVILFQNRRGYSTMLECKDCGWVPHCQNCNVSLTFHKYENRLVCHYCGEKFSLPAKCGNCGSENLTQRGLGTEKIEEQVKALIPQARVERLDYDTAQSRKNYERIITNFADGEIDILVGTQMITKGLDFPNVSLVGILNADNMLNFPDFRAFERSFQLMSQVSGRAGRRQKQGKVVIQTFSPDHEIIQSVLCNDYAGMAERQIAEREAFHYPPLFNFITLRLKHKDRQRVEKAAMLLTVELQKTLKSRVRGPEEPLVNRISNYFIMNVHLRFEKTLSAAKIKAFVKEKISLITAVSELSQIKVEIDVDPY